MNTTCLVLSPLLAAAILAVRQGAPVPSAVPPASAVPPVAAIEKLAKELVADPRVPGLALGRLDGTERVLHCAGVLTAGEPGNVDPGTLFEIGSISKAFTGTLLADLVVNGEAELDDPVADLLPEGWSVPDFHGTAITLRDLASHTSGLPSLPLNLDLKNADDPYASYGSKELEAGLAKAPFSGKPGTRYAYSNLGAGLLGFALGHHMGMSYAELLRERILEPLGMTETFVETPPALLSREAGAHDVMGEPSFRWHLDALAGAGAIRSSLRDMLKFAAAACTPQEGPLGPAFTLAQTEVFRIDPTLSVGLGWHLLKRSGRTLVWHNGRTGGFRSMLVLDRDSRRASVVLTNSSADADALGHWLLDAAAPLPQLPPSRATVAVDAKVLASYGGEYRFAPNASATITLRARRGVDIQLTGQPRFRLYASSPTDFFVNEVDASVTFECDPRGRVTGLVLHQGGADQRAAKVK